MKNCYGRIARDIASETSIPFIGPHKFINSKSIARAAVSLGIGGENMCEVLCFKASLIRQWSGLLAFSS